MDLNTCRHKRKRVRKQTHPNVGYCESAIHCLYKLPFVLRCRQHCSTSPSCVSDMSHERYRCHTFLYRVPPSQLHARTAKAIGLHSTQLEYPGNMQLSVTSPRLQVDERMPAEPAVTVMCAAPERVTFTAWYRELGQGTYPPAFCIGCSIPF